MLTKENFNESHVRMLQKQSKKDPALLERVVFAFGLLEAIRRVECRLFLKEHPMRLSTDIDIVVEPDTDVDTYIWGSVMLGNGGDKVPLGMVIFLVRNIVLLFGAVDLVSAIYHLMLWNRNGRHSMDDDNNGLLSD